MSAECERRVNLLLLLPDARRPGFVYASFRRILQPGSLVPKPVKLGGQSLAPERGQPHELSGPCPGDPQR
jgi:hypothetical protein